MICIMWIEIDNDIFQKSDFKGLNYLYQILSWYPNHSVPRYKIFIDLLKVENTQNYNQLKGVETRLKELIESQFDEFITANPRNKRPSYQVTYRKGEKCFNIEEAIRFFSTPVAIVIENSLNDSYFLKAIFSHFDPKDEHGRRRLVEFLRNDWIQFVNAGGWTNIRNIINGRSQSFEELAKNNSKNPNNYLRCFVLMDSDRQYATNNIQDKEDLKKWLEDLGIKVHILNKRAMENYMPDEVIKVLPTINSKYKQFQKWVNAYDNLNQEQKDYLNYQKGFPKKDVETVINKKKITQKVNKVRNEQPIDIQTLFPISNIDNTQYDVIDTGLKEFPNFKDEFPKFFHIDYYFKEKTLTKRVVVTENNDEFLKVNHLINKKNLLTREGGTENSNEFLEILQKINDLL